MRKLLNEQLNISSSNPIKIRRFDYKYFTYPWHYHSQFEIMYVQQGKGCCNIGDSVTDFSDNNLIFFGPELPHWMQSLPQYEEDNDLRTSGIIIQFEKEFMQHSIQNYVQFTRIRKLMEHTERGLFFNISKYPEIQETLEKLPDSTDIEQIVLILRLFTQLAEVDNCKSVASPNYNLTLQHFKDNRFEKVIEYLNNHYVEKLTLGDISSFACMNSSAFCRLFKEKMGETLTAYITRMRIGYACKLLASERFNITQIALQCGFESLSQFNRSFKHIMQQTPSEYRSKLE